MTDQSSPPKSSRKRRQTKACGRCRKRKIRCDLQYPSCSACYEAGATCVGFDSVQKVEQPRSIVRHLEEQITHLERNLASTKAQTDGISIGFESTVDALTNSLATTIAEPSEHHRKQQDLLPLISKYFLSDSPSPHLNYQISDDMEETTTCEVQSSQPMEISSIPRHVIDAMLKHYCDTYRPQYPSIDEADLYEARDRIYDNPKLGGYDAFIIHVTLAISSNTLMHIDEKRAMTTTRGLWTTALLHLEQVGDSSSWERLQALQLLTHYGFLNPQDVNVGHCAAAATRLAVKLGLHRELPGQQQMKLESTILNSRRRMFWNAYSIDAAVHINRGQPFRWTRSEITAKFPNSESQAIPTHSAHMWSLRNIECDINLGLHYPIFDARDVDTPFEIWYVRMYNRLTEWYETIRQSVNLTEKIEFHEILFQAQVLRLNKSSPRCPVPTEEMRKKAIKACITLIKEYSIFDQLGKMFTIWHAALCVIEAGVYLLSSILVGLESGSPNRSRVGDEEVTILVKYVKIFPSLIWRISRRWPRIMRYAPALETVSNSVLDKLQQWSDGMDLCGPDFFALQERIAQLMPSSLASSNQLNQGILLLQPRTTNLDQAFTTPLSLVAPLDSAFESSNNRLPTRGNAASIDSDYSGSQAGLNQDLVAFSGSYDTDYGGIMAWDFSGIDSEEIFSAFLEPRMSDFAML